MIIKVENNIQEILTYLEAKGYVWFGSKKKPTEHIEHVSSASTIFIYSDKTIGYDYEHSYVEAISLEQFKKENPMKKSDLKPGMVVEYANGDKRLVISMNDKLYLIGTNIFAELENFNKDLTNIYRPELEIVKIYQPEDASGLCCLLSTSHSLIWERSKETVLTMQEIADKFGIPVEQLKIKK